MWGAVWPRRSAHLVTMEEETEDEEKEEEHMERRRWEDILYHDLTFFLLSLCSPPKGFTVLPQHRRSPLRPLAIEPLGDI